MTSRVLMTPCLALLTGCAGLAAAETGSRAIPVTDIRRIAGGEHHFRIVTNLHAEGDAYLMLNNEAGTRLLAGVPLRAPQTGTCTLTIRYATGTPDTDRTLALFAWAGVLDLRIMSEEIYLLDKGRAAKTVIGKHWPDRPIELTFVLDATARCLRSATVNGAPAPDVDGTPWLGDRPGEQLLIYGPVDSAVPSYIGPLTVPSAPVDDAFAERDVPWLQRPPHVPPDDPESTGVYRIPGEYAGTPADVDPERLAHLQFPAAAYFTAAEARRIPAILRDDPAAQAFWTRLRRNVQNILVNRGTPHGAGRDQLYVKAVGPALSQLALFHLVTGDAAVAAALKALMLDTARRPLGFWIHEQLRRYDPDFPVGGLETAHLTRHMATAYNWTHDLYSETEREVILEALRHKGLYPSLRWIERAKASGGGNSNWLAVLAAGALAGARILAEPEAEELAVAGLRGWLQLIEEDGSYGEPVGYLEYGLGTFITGALLLGGEQSVAMVAPTPLRRTLNYMLYHYTKAHPESGAAAFRVNFGDDDILTGPGKTVLTFLAYAFDQGAARWLAENLSSGQDADNYDGFLMRVMFAGRQVAARHPETLHLPLAAGFDSGVGFLHSGWSMTDDTILALRGGAGTRTRYAHDRPNRNAIILLDRGECFIVTPGRASYRSPLFRQWDRKTAAHSTITFAAADQLQHPVATEPVAAAGDHVLSLVCDATQAYPETGRPAAVTRGILFVRDPGYFLVIDDVREPPPDQPVEWRLFFANWDGKTTLDKPTAAMTAATRAGIRWDAHVWSNHPLTPSFDDGIMHTGYSYFPDGPNEGKPGSSLHWRQTAIATRQTLRFVALLTPAPITATSAENADVLRLVGDGFSDSLTVGDRQLTIIRDGAWAFELSPDGTLNRLR